MRMDLHSVHVSVLHSETLKSIIILQYLSHFTSCIVHHTEPITKGMKHSEHHWRKNRYITSIHIKNWVNGFEFSLSHKVKRDGLGGFIVAFIIAKENYKPISYGNIFMRI